MTHFDYLLNAFEAASQSDSPAKEGYAEKRRALFAYVRELEERRKEGDRLRAELAEAQEKALRFDLDRAGIERREQKATELVQLHAECLRLHYAEAEAMALVLSQEEQIERMRKDAIDHTGLRVACQYLLQAYEDGSDLQTSIDRVERALAAKGE